MVFGGKRQWLAASDARSQPLERPCHQPHLSCDLLFRSYVDSKIHLHDAIVVDVAKALRAACLACKA